jgi:hypothetical protein
MSSACIFRIGIIPFSSSQLERVAGVVGELFKSMGPLEELTLGTSDLRPYLAPFVSITPTSTDIKESFAYPQIKGLTIADLRKPLGGRLRGCNRRVCEVAAFDGRVPFERVVFRVTEPSADMAERLQPWVGSCASGKSCSRRPVVVFARLYIVLC